MAAHCPVTVAALGMERIFVGGADAVGAGRGMAATTALLHVGVDAGHAAQCAVVVSDGVMATMAGILVLVALVGKLNRSCPTGVFCQHDDLWTAPRPRTGRRGHSGW